METGPEPTVGCRLRLTPRQLVVRIALAFLALDVLHWIFESRAYYQLPTPFGILLAAVLGAEMMLTIVWVVFGLAPLRLRMMTGLLLLLLVAARGVSVFFFLDWFLVVGLHFLTNFLPAIIFRALGWRLMRFANSSEIAAWYVSRRPVQFTLKQMFIWTTVAAVLAALSRLLQPVILARFGISLLQNLLIGGIVVATVWSALGRGQLALRLGVCVAAACSTVCLLLLEPDLSKFLNAGDLTWIGFRYALEVAMVGAVLLVFRAQRFRFVRMQRARTFDPSPTAPSDGRVEGKT